jgi:hypothetical protein
MEKTEIIEWRCEFIIMTIERISAMNPKLYGRDSGTSDRKIRTEAVSFTSTSWYLGRHHLGDAIHLLDDNYHTRYHSYHLSQYAKAFKGVGNVLPGTTFQDQQIQSAVGNVI